MYSHALAGELAELRGAVATLKKDGGEAEGAALVVAELVKLRASIAAQSMGSTVGPDQLVELLTGLAASSAAEGGGDADAEGGGDDEDDGLGQFYLLGAVALLVRPKPPMRDTIIACLPPADRCLVFVAWIARTDRAGASCDPAGRDRVSHRRGQGRRAR